MAFNLEDELKKNNEKIDEILAFQEEEDEFEYIPSNEEVEKSVDLKIKNLKQRSFKKVIVAASILASVTVLGATYIKGYKDGKNNISEISTVYDNIEKNEQISFADDEVINSYLDNSFGKYEEYISNGTVQSYSDFEILKKDFYDPVKIAYSDYLDAKTDDDKTALHANFTRLARDYNAKISSSKKDLAFENSIYAYAKSIDGEVCVPYNKTITDGVLPSNYKTYDNVIYIPVNTLSQDDIKTLGND